ncbi:MAG: flagellar hook-length control protein FliK [Pseudazoarcus pumilus]|nr:flagellar hook-length control protein FliK [Pseudazoarcus pumilus]
MAHTSIQAGANRPDLNPAALFQAAPNPEPSGNASFEAALDRAREPERPEPAQSAQPRQNEHNKDTARPPENRPANAERPQESTAERTNENTPTREAEATATSDTPAEQTGKATTAEEESPAALPAEIAAILAALALATGRGVRPVDGEAPDTALSPLLADAGKGKGGNAAQGNTPQFTLPGTGAGKDSGELPIALAARDSTVQQAVALATQSAPGRSFADQILAGMRGEGVPGLQGAGLPFTARGEASQQIQQLTQLPVSTPAGQRGWATEIGNQVSWMLGRNESKAELVLTPPSLGKLGVSIQVNGEQTTAHFVAATQAARDALEQAMPRLREVLQQAGINLGQTNVSTSGDQRAHDGGGNEQRGGWGRSQGGEAGSAGVAAATAASSWVRSGNGVIDTFA